MFFLLSLQISKQHVDIMLFKDEVYSTLQKSKQRINIVLSNKGVCTLIDVIVVNPAYIPMFSVRNNFYSWFCNFKANPNLDSFLLNPTIAWQNKLKAYLPCQHFNCVRKVKREKYMLKQVISKKDLWLDKAMLLSINDPLVLLPAWLTIQKIEAQKVLTHTWSLCFYSWATISSKACTGMCWEIDQSYVQNLPVLGFRTLHQSVIEYCLQEIHQCLDLNTWKAFFETFKFRPLSAKTCSLSKLKRVFPIGLLNLKRIEILKVAYCPVQPTAHPPSLPSQQTACHHKCCLQTGSQRWMQVQPKVPF